MGGGAEGFKMCVSKKEVVTPVLPMQEQWLPLSNLDLLLPPVNVGLFFCYRNPNSALTGKKLTLANMVSSLKRALAQALVSYYAFAGELVLNSVGEPMLLCNEKGVDFTEAFADVELQELSLYNPDESIEGKLVPERKHGVLAVQVTQLKCGGLVVGCTFDHRIADAYSANMFLVSWAEISQFQPTLFQPSFRRSLLDPRRPILIDPSLNDMYVPINTLSSAKEEDSDVDHLVSRIYYVTSEQINLMQSIASSSGIKRTKLESFSAFLWKMIAKHAMQSDARNTRTRLGIVVDGRTRLGNGNEEKTKLMATYFGNVISIPFGSMKVTELIEKPLNCVADEVHDILDVAMTKEHFLGLIDWVEAHKPTPALAKIYCVGFEDGPGFVVSSGLRFPVEKVDFRWGKPAFGSYHFPWRGNSGYVMPMPSPKGNGDWIVYMHLSREQLEFIESEAPAVFRPLTSNYLDL
uniref:Cinnamyl alcohol acyltransferase 2 n=1 Tax=Larrea tridentata TaxID=66636 RepID=V5NRH0_LARTR|nr:cinnamyl alcohol acyltransferase 2 [Larrea tridentata]